MKITPMTRADDNSSSHAYSKEEWETRVNLAACYRLVHYYGWTTQVYNHITARIPGTEELLINPFGHMYDEITPSSLVKIDLDGNKLDDNPYPINAAGYTIHSAIHAARPDDVQCVLHAHTDNATALSAVKCNFIPLTQEGCMFHERVSYHEFEGLALDLSERERLVKDLGPVNHTLLLYNHGIVTMGPSIPIAFSRFYYFEIAAGVQLKAMASGQPLRLLPEEILFKTRGQFENFDMTSGDPDKRPEWPAYLRMLDRLDPHWRD